MQIQGNKLAVLPSVITLHFANAGITDNTDLMRCNLFGFAVARFIEKYDKFESADAYTLPEYHALPFVIDFDAMNEITDKVNSFIFSEVV